LALRHGSCRQSFALRRPRHGRFASNRRSGKPHKRGCPFNFEEDFDVPSVVFLCAAVCKIRNEPGFALLDLDGRISCPRPCRNRYWLRPHRYRSVLIGGSRAYFRENFRIHQIDARIISVSVCPTSFGPACLTSGMLSIPRRRHFLLGRLPVDAAFRPFSSFAASLSGPPPSGWPRSPLTISNHRIRKVRLPISRDESATVRNSWLPSSAPCRRLLSTTASPSRWSPNMSLLAISLGAYGHLAQS